MKTESSPKSASEAKAYPPSFVDRLMAWIERLPVPVWVFYLSVTLLFVVLGHGLRWLDGSLQPGTFDPLRFANDSLTFYSKFTETILHYSLNNWEEKFEEYLADLQVGVVELKEAAPQTEEERHRVFLLKKKVVDTLVEEVTINRNRELLIFEK